MLLGVHAERKRDNGGVEQYEICYIYSTIVGDSMNSDTMRPWKSELEVALFCWDYWA